MTTVVALRGKNRLHLAADSCLYSENEKYQSAQAKIWKQGKLGFGYVGAPLVQNVLLYDCKFSYSGMSLPKWIHKTLAPLLQEKLSDRGALNLRDGAFEMPGDSSLLIANHQCIVELESDFQVVEFSLPYIALGAGRAFAMGSLASTTGSGKTRVKKAVSVAKSFSQLTDGDIDYLKV